MTSLFCCLPESRVLLRNETAIVVRDAFPVTQGHTLVPPPPRRTSNSTFDTSAKERAAMFDLLDATQRKLQTEFAPTGFNIGINDGAAAGQTICHLHMHLIPRYVDDRSDPSSGVRWIIPKKAAYWTTADRKTFGTTAPAAASATASCC